MVEFFRRHSLVLAALGLFVCSLQLMSLSIQHPAIPRSGGQLLNSALAPIQKLYHEVSETGQHLINHYIWLQGVEEERNELAKRIKALEAENSRIVEYKTENERLRKLLDYRDGTGAEGLVAAVIGRDPSNWVKTVTINKGSADGLRPGLPVVDGQAIVGQTIAVSSNSSKVLLITDNTSAIDAIVQTNRAPGVAEGTMERMLELRYLLKEYPVSPGDRVLASGLDGIYPKGGLIGVVTSVRPTPTGLFQQVELQPSVDINRIEDVLVLTSQRGVNQPEGSKEVNQARGMDSQKPGISAQRSEHPTAVPSVTPHVELPTPPLPPETQPEQSTEVEESPAGDSE